MWTTLQVGIALLNWKRWFVLLCLIARADNLGTVISSSNAKSTAPLRKSERELPPAGRFVISFQEQSKKSFTAKNFTWSRRNNPGEFSQNLRRIRLEQEGGRNRRFGFAIDFDVYRFFRDLLSYI